MGELPKDKTTLLDDHHNLLMEAIQDDGIARESKIYSYGRSFNGFAAKLLPHEAKRLSRNDKVVSVFPSAKYKLQTTRSWDFLGMPLHVTRNKGVESNVIIGLIDSGIYLPSKSFSDAGFGPPPKKWKGQCQTSHNFPACNNKVIGAQTFAKKPPGQESPGDYDGHGTHTSSIAAGVPVENASVYGIGQGTARGGVPLARIAMYKACDIEDCDEEDILAAFDAAIDDGVDIISVSLGVEPGDYLHNAIAIGSYHAIIKGILVSASAGNSGTQLPVDNTAPWIMTVAASTIDRAFYAQIELGNGKTFHGNAISLFNMEKMYPLMGVMKTFQNGSCDLGGVHKEARGKIVYCIGVIDEQNVNLEDLGIVGAIMISDKETDTPDVTTNSVTKVTSGFSKLIETYINSTRNPEARIYKSTEERAGSRAPMVASFSSRGPDIISKTILKPDLAAPGDAILAAYSELTTPDNNDSRVAYNILSGTSMAAPHVASVAAYLKSFHPDWSPAIIRSALMTTAKPMRFNQGEPIELASGAGNIDPIAALDPGLVYDIDLNSYSMYNCVPKHSLQSSGKNRNKCPDIPDQMGYDGLNYPSFHYQLNSPNETQIAATFYRNVTYLGQGESEYKVIVDSSQGLSIKVEPEILLFSETGQQKSFTVMLKGQFMDKKQWYLSGSIAWDDSVHLVKSPVLVYRQPSYLS